MNMHTTHINALIKIAITFKLIVIYSNTLGTNVFD